jgi:hypothetical protein
MAALTGRREDRMRAVLIAGLLLLAACVDRLAERRAFLDTLVGTSEENLVRTLGVPTRVVEANGHRFLAYTESWVDVIPSGPVMPWGWPRYWGGDFPPEVVQRVCETTLEVGDGKVRGYVLRGNACD